MKSKKILFTISLITLLYSLNIFSQENLLTVDRVGWWNFNDTTNINASVPGFGLPLDLVGSHEIVPGPIADDFAVRIGVGSHYKMHHQISPNGGGSKVNEYSLQFDFKVESIGQWYTFFQTDLSNSSDGECFISQSGNIGVAATGYSSYAVVPNEWYRMVISVKNGTQYIYYLDGQLLNAGTVQAIDGRFSLDSLLLAFADENAEDNDIIISELAIWDRAITGVEAADLGGFGHNIGTPPGTQLILVPYLQTPTSSSIYVCWHDTSSAPTSVDYGTTSALGQTTSGTSEIIAGAYRWHYTHLENLSPNTEYFYKCSSGSGSSEIYSFRTLPDNNYTGKLRFLLFSDTHSNDTTWAGIVIRSAKKKAQELFGSDIQNHINLVLHSGDLVVDGGNIVQWTDQYFGPIRYLSTNLSFMPITGNHEIEHQNYYKYMHLDDVSPVPAASEKFWTFRIANTVLIGLNSNAVSTYGTVQKAWLDSYLAQVEADPTVDFVFTMTHHFIVSEIWGEGMTYEQWKVDYVRDELYPIFKKYSKVVQHSNGHTHAYERGTVETEDPNAYGDMRTIIGGGGGGYTDFWGDYLNIDYANVHISLDHHMFQLIEIDIANKTYESTMYSLGNDNLQRDIEAMDHWYRKFNQPAPEAPISFPPDISAADITFNTSPINADSIMTARIQISDVEDFSSVIIDSMQHWTDIYQVDANFNPIDRNAGIDLTKLKLNSSLLSGGEKYYYRVKYRDHNVKWSVWSNVTSFNVLVNVDEENIVADYFLAQNFPNPFNPSTQVEFGLKERGLVSLKIYDVLGKLVKEILNRELSAGNYTVTINASDLPSGVYFYNLKSENFVQTKKMLLVK